MGSSRVWIGKSPSLTPTPNSFDGRTRPCLPRKVCAHAATPQRRACGISAFAVRSCFLALFLAHAQCARAAQFAPRAALEADLRARSDSPPVEFRAVCALL